MTSKFEVCVLQVVVIGRQMVSGLYSCVHSVVPNGVYEYKHYDCTLYAIACLSLRVCTVLAPFWCGVHFACTVVGRGPTTAFGRGSRVTPN